MPSSTTSAMRSVPRQPAERIRASKAREIRWLGKLGGQAAVTQLGVTRVILGDMTARAVSARPTRTGLELRRLDRLHADKLVARIHGHEPDPAPADAVYLRAEGNPLFVAELLCADCRGGVASAVPESLRDLLLAAVRQLPEGTQEVLGAASAGCQRIGHWLLAVRELAAQLPAPGLVQAANLLTFWAEAARAAGPDHGAAAQTAPPAT